MPEAQQRRPAVVAVRAGGRIPVLVPVEPNPRGAPSDAEILNHGVDGAVKQRRKAPLEGAVDLAGHRKLASVIVLGVSRTGREVPGEPHALVPDVVPRALLVDREVGGLLLEPEAPLYLEGGAGQRKLGPMIA